VDTNLRPGHTYYYRVRAFDGKDWTWLTATPKVEIPLKQAGGSTNVDIDVSAAKSVGILQHKWETAIGSEHLSYMLKRDTSDYLHDIAANLRRANRQMHDGTGIRYVIAHGILDDDLDTYSEDREGHPVYNWSGIDSIYDRLTADGLKPIIQLDFMPEALARHTGWKNTIHPYSYRANNSPPKDYAKWGNLLSALAEHLIQRYGKDEVETWPFEVWNEPDICFLFVVHCYWSGSEEDYFRLYDYSVHALKSVDPKLRVGGPVQVFKSVVPFLHHVTTHDYVTGAMSVPLDFLDVRGYQTPAADWRPVLSQYGLTGTPIYYTEWGLSQVPLAANDMPYSAAWIVHGLHESIDQVSLISHWTASDYFEELGPPKAFFYGGFGLIGLDSIRKPAYWAYYMLHELGTHRLALDGKGDGFGGLITGWATSKGQGNVQILLSNVTEDQVYAFGNPRLSRRIFLTVSNLSPHSHYRVQHFRVDASHSNVYASWQSMNSPTWPTSSQLAELHQHDNLERLEADREIIADDKGHVLLDFDMPMPSVSLITLWPAKATATRGQVTPNPR